MIKLSKDMDGLWAVAGRLFLAWLIAVVVGRRGMIHVLLLTAIAIAVVKFMSVRRARA